jgi:hypothetical protein
MKRSRFRLTLILETSEIDKASDIDVRHWEKHACSDGESLTLEKAEKIDERADAVD